MTHPTARQQAVIDEPGNCLVVAGPGSGKTATMVKKIAKLLTNASSRIVAVTFTRDGANELMHRLRKAVPASALGRVTVGTFHSLTLRHMRANKMAYKLASPQQQREKPPKKPPSVHCPLGVLLCQKVCQSKTKAAPHLVFASQPMLFPLL